MQKIYFLTKTSSTFHTNAKDNLLTKTHSTSPSLTATLDNISHEGVTV